MSKASISVIMPVYNEEEIVEGAILKNIRVLKNAGLTFEIIIVNDGSSDRSRDVIEHVAGKLDCVSVLHHKRNLGLGGAIRSGLERCSLDVVTVVPADSPLTQELMEGFYRFMPLADVVVAYRRVRLGYSKMMKLNSMVFHMLVTVLFGMQLKDYNWVHLYPRNLFTEGNVTVTYSGLFALAEILIKAKWAGCTFVEFEVEQQQRLTGTASASKIINVLRTLRDVVHFRAVSLLRESGV
jgi:glycosyltransferase involved in cell wall biosynthesis